MPHSPLRQCVLRWALLGAIGLKHNGDREPGYKNNNYDVMPVRLVTTVTTHPGRYNVSVMGLRRLCFRSWWWVRID